MHTLRHWPTVGGQDPMQNHNRAISPAINPPEALKALRDAKAAAETAKQCDADPNQGRAPARTNEPIQPTKNLLGTTTAVSGIDAEKSRESHAKLCALAAERHFSLNYGLLQCLIIQQDRPLNPARQLTRRTRFTAELTRNIPHLT